MPTCAMVDVDEQPYLYIERSCSMDPVDISKNMEIAFRTVGGFVGTNAITSVKHALSV